MADLSGRVAILEAQMINVEQQILSYPTSDDFDSLSSQSSARYNVLTAQLTDTLNKLTDLETYVVNLKLYTTSLQRSLTGHTGVCAQSGHHGGLTGEL